MQSQQLVRALRPSAQHRPGDSANATRPEPVTPMLVVLPRLVGGYDDASAEKYPQLSTPCKSAISTGCESHPANWSLGRKQPGRRRR